MNGGKVRLNLASVQSRGGAFAKAAMRLGTVMGNRLELARETFVELTGQKEAKPKAKAVAEWPLPLRILARRRIPEDEGLGDTVARIIGPIGGDAFKLWHRLVFGRDCGCANRQAWLNARWPYPQDREGGFGAGQAVH